MVKYLGNWWLSGIENKVHRRVYHEWESDSTPAEAAYRRSKPAVAIYKMPVDTPLGWLSGRPEFSRQPQHLFDT
jgi:hypothetical protein